MTNKRAEEILIKEYLSKCECCDECFAEYFCIKNDLRESREPKDYCVENIRQYLSARLKKVIEDDGDLISRATVIRLTKEMISAEEYGLMDLLDEVKKLSSASLTVKANWVGIDDEPQEDFECSHCGRIVYGITPGYVYKEFPYCPGCGSKMEGGQNEQS